MLKNNQTECNTQRLLTAKEAAIYLAISERKLWQLTKDKRLSSVKIDRVVRYDIADLESFIAEMKVCL